jgi:hypothetical protein
LNIKYKLFRKICFNFELNILTNIVAAEPEGSTPPTPKPTAGHHPEPVPSASHPHNLSP